jgi:hypothetical protein
MSDFKLDPVTGDLDLSTGDLQFVTGADAVAQHLLVRLRFYLGEWFLDTRVGIPYYSQILVKNPNLAAIRTTYRQAILSTPGVETLERMDLEFDAATRELALDFSARLAGETVARDFSEVFIL